MYNLKKIFLMLLWIFAVTFFENVEAAIVTDKMPLQCYVDHKVTSYDVNSGQAVGWIDADVDLVEITGIGGNGVAIGTHPSGSRRVQRLFWARDVFADINYANRNVHVNGSHQVYRTKSSSATIGSIANEDVTVVADNGNRAQIVYRLNNGTGYKMGWVPSSVVRGGGGNVTNIKGDLNNDGRVDNADLDLMRDYMIERIGDSAINKNNADIDGNGQITVSDFSRLSDMINGPKYAQPEEGDYYIVPINSTCAIDVPNNWHNEGNILQIYGQNQMPAQIFTIRRVGNGWYKIIHKDSGNVMNVQGGNNGNGTRLWLYHYDGTASCHWRFRDLGGGVYNIESQLPSNPFLEVQNGNPFNGAVLQLWQQHNGNAAKWTLKKASPPPNNKLQELIQKWNGQKWDDGYSRSPYAEKRVLNSDAIQCKEFATYIFNILYDTGSVGSGSSSTNPTNWRLNNIPSTIYQVAEVSENRNAAQAKEQFKNLFAKAQQGDFIQIKRGHGGAHSAIFVGRTDNGIQWFDANADNNNGIKLQTYSYDDLVATKKRKNKDGTYSYYQWNVAMSLYRAR